MSAFTKLQHQKVIKDVLEEESHSDHSDNEVISTECV
jgi:hypothetical protein